MTKSAVTVKVFGLYMICLGVILLTVPNVLLSLFRMQTTSEVWIHVVGVLILNIGIYYWYAAKCEAVAFFRASVYTRVFVLIAFAIFAVLGLVSPVLILFGSIDFLGAVWTSVAIRSEAAQ